VSETLQNGTENNIPYVFVLVIMIEFERASHLPPCPHFCFPYFTPLSYSQRFCDELISRFMATRKTTPYKKSLFIRTHTLTEENERTLQQLSQETSDVIGWTVSNSAVVRALLRYATEQPSSWVSTTLAPLIEQEMQTGIIWGSKKTG
jgi:hypothetical protein